MASSDSARLLVTGGSGQVGGELVRSLASLGTVVSPSREQLDLADAASIRACVREVRARWIVNAGAYTAVDRAESEPERAYAINAEAVRVLGEEARAQGAAVIHFSTDYVFDGEGSGAYCENDRTGPRNVYGASKLAGEEALAAANPASLVFRTSWVYGPTGKNFLLTVLKLAREREELRIVGDQHGAPTWSRDLARMTAQVISRCESRASGEKDLLAEVSSLAGVYHAAGGGETTWAGFAEEALRLAGKASPAIPLARIVAIPTSEYPTAARRPHNSRLNCSRLSEVFGWTMMPWTDSVRDVLAEV